MPLLKDSNGLISLFRGTFCDLTQGHSRPPKSSADICDAVLKKLNAPHLKVMEEIEREWESCVPKKLSGKTSPRNLRSATLYVSSVNALARQDATFCEREILQKLKKIKGCSGIKKIRFV